VCVNEFDQLALLVNVCVGDCVDLSLYDVLIVKALVSEFVIVLKSSVRITWLSDASVKKRVLVLGSSASPAGEVSRALAPTPSTCPAAAVGGGAPATVCTWRVFRFTTRIECVDADAAAPPPDTHSKSERASTSSPENR